MYVYTWYVSHYGDQLSPHNSKTVNFDLVETFLGPHEEKTYKSSRIKCFFLSKKS